MILRYVGSNEINFHQYICTQAIDYFVCILNQMGTSYKMAIFEEHIQEGLVGWAKSAKKHQAALRKATNGSSSNRSSQVGHSSKYIHKEEAAATTTTTTTTTSSTLELAQVGSKESSVHVGEIQPHQLPPASDHVQRSIHQNHVIQRTLHACKWD